MGCQGNLTSTTMGNQSDLFQLVMLFSLGADTVKLYGEGTAHFAPKG